MTKALVVLSGGQDSTTCLYWAKANFEEVHAITFSYGQKHAQEVIQAGKIGLDARVRSHLVLDVQHALGSNSSLTDWKRAHSDGHPQNPKLPASFTPGRNMMFLTLAAAHAFELGIRHIITGVCQTDYSGYPDCRMAFIDSMEKTLSFALDPDYNGSLYVDRVMRIEAPLMNRTKAETWKLAVELGCFDVIVNDTMTDYNGDTTRNPWGMGIDNNPATHLRKLGFEEAREKGWLQPYYAPIAQPQD